MRHGGAAMRASCTSGSRFWLLARTGCRIALWLAVIGVFGHPDKARANCTFASGVVTCDSSAPNPYTSTIGTYAENGWSVTLLDGAQIVVGDTNAIALRTNASIVLGPGSLVENVPVRGGGYAGGGAETIVLRSGGSITIDAGARVIDNGYQSISSAIEVLRGGAYIDNSGLIESQLAAGLLLGPNSTLINRASGVIESVAGGTVFYQTSAFTLVNYGTILGDVVLDYGPNAVTLYTGSSISGLISLGGGENTLTLAGAGTSVLGNTTTGLTHLVKVDSGTWTFSAPQAAPQTIAVQAGTLLFRGGVAASSLSVATGAIFDAPAAVLPTQTVNDGLVRVSVTPGTVDYAGSVTGSGTFEKTGDGVLALSGTNTWTGPTFVDAGTLAATHPGALSAASAVVLAPGTSLSMSASQTLGALFGAGSVNIDPSTLTVGANNEAALFSGVLQGNGGVVKSGTQVFVLTGNETYTGGTTVQAGELALEGLLSSGVSVEPGARLSGAGRIVGPVLNAGTVAAGAYAFTVDVPVLQSDGAPTTTRQSTVMALAPLTIDGAYTSESGALALRTVINDGGPGRQMTDRLLVGEGVAGATLIHITPDEGSWAASTGTSPTSGISIVQVAGQALPSNFALPAGYVAAGPYRMRLVYFGPGQSASSELDPHLAATGATSFSDYRLQTEDVLPPGTPPADDPGGEPIGSGPDGEHSGSEVLIPQVPAYLAVETGALHYGSLLVDDLHKRAVELPDPVYDTITGPTPTAFFRAKGWTGNIEGDAEPNFHQRIWIAQIGGGVVWPDLWQPGDRLDTSVVLSQGGSSSSVSVNHSGARFDATGLGVTATYRAVCGAYVDAVMEGLFFTDVGFYTDQRGTVGTTSADGFVTSIETGMPFDVAQILTVEPRVAIEWQSDSFRSFTDIDDVQVDPGDASSLQARIGGRFSRRFDLPWGGGSLVLEPFATVDYVRALDGHNHESIGGVVFADDAGGSALRYGGGFDLRVHDRLHTFVSFEHASGRGAPSATGNEVLGTFRYTF